MKINISLEISGTPFLPSNTNQINFFRRLSLAIFLGLSITVASIASARGLDWHSHPGNIRCIYIVSVAGCSIITSALAVRQAPSSAPVWLDAGLGILFAAAWFVAYVLSVGKWYYYPLGLLSFLAFATLLLYLSLLGYKILWAFSRGEKVWLRPVHELDEGSIKLTPDADSSEESTGVDLSSSAPSQV